MIQECETRTLSSHLLDATLDTGFQLDQPLLHLASSLGGADDLGQTNDLALTWPHSHNLQVVAKVQWIDPFEALLEVRLNPTFEAKENVLRRR